MAGVRLVASTQREKGGAMIELGGGVRADYASFLFLHMFYADYKA